MLERTVDRGALCSRQSSGTFAFISSVHPASALERSRMTRDSEITPCHGPSAALWALLLLGRSQTPSQGCVTCLPRCLRRSPAAMVSGLTAKDAPSPQAGSAAATGSDQQSSGQLVPTRNVDTGTISATASLRLRCRLAQFEGRRRIIPAG